jgi:hypothetical protein
MAACSRDKATSMEAVALDDIEGQRLNNTDNTEISERNTDIQRKIIKEGNIRFETTNSEKTRGIILSSVKENNGYISSDNASNYDGNTEYRMTIRVPSDHFDRLLEDISRSAQKLDSKNINALDVTEEFVDIEARIKAKKELEDRYRELLKKAVKVDEMLTIEREIGTLRTDIESIEGRLRYLKSKVAYSTLTVVFYEKTASSFGFWHKFVHAIQNGWTNVLWFFIGLTHLWPFLLIGVIIIIVVRRVKRSGKK